MARKKSHREDEDLKGEIKKLKSIIRNLQKRLRQYEKFEYYFEEAFETIEESKAKEAEQEYKADKCEVCGKGELRIIDLGRNIYTACTVCDYRVKRGSDGKTK